MDEGDEIVENKSKKAKYLLVGLFAVAAVAIGVWMGMNMDWLAVQKAAEEGIAVESQAITESESGAIKIDELLLLTSGEQRVREIYQPEREYGNGVVFDLAANRSIEFPISLVFNKIPPLPDDFWNVKYTALMDGYTHLGVIHKEYWLQPEFVELCDAETSLCVNSFEKFALPYYAAPNPGIWFREGYGTFPANLPSTGSYALTRGSNLTLYVLLQTAWNVETYQGLRLVPVGGENLKLTVTPSDVLLEPAYIQIEPGYRRLIRVDVAAAKDAEPGNYTVGFDVARARPDLEGEWSSRYGIKYQPLGFMRVGRPMFLARLEVR